MYRWLPRLLVASVVLAALFVGPVPLSSASSKTVVLKNVAFSPRTLTVSRGSKVTFLWRDGITEHNVTSRGTPRFKGSGSKAHGKLVVHFRKYGTYRYECTLHFGMTGRVKVR